MESPVPLVQLRPKRQLTVPTEVAQQLDLKAGDYLEASAEGNRLVFTVKAVQDRAIAGTSTCLDILEDKPTRPPASLAQQTELLCRLLQARQKAEAAGLSSSLEWQEAASAYAEAVLAEREDEAGEPSDEQRQAFMAYIENLPRADTKGEGSVELLRRLRQERLDYIVARHNPTKP